MPLGGEYKPLDVFTWREYNGIRIVGKHIVFDPEKIADEVYRKWLEHGKDVDTRIEVERNYEGEYNSVCVLKYNFETDDTEYLCFEFKDSDKVDKVLDILEKKYGCYLTEELEEGFQYWNCSRD